MNPLSIVKPVPVLVTQLLGEKSVACVWKSKTRRVLTKCSRMYLFEVLGHELLVENLSSDSEHYKEPNQVAFKC